MDRGETSDKILIAAARDRPFEESGAPDTPVNRELYSRMKAEIGSFPDGTIVDVPGE